MPARCVKRSAEHDDSVLGTVFRVARVEAIRNPETTVARISAPPSAAVGRESQISASTPTRPRRADTPGVRTSQKHCNNSRQFKAAQQHHQKAGRDDKPRGCTVVQMLQWGDGVLEIKRGWEPRRIKQFHTAPPKLDDEDS